jgi:formate dehydrogenase major subunit/formate dehydrogenase alpha subunit
LFVVGSNTTEQHPIIGIEMKKALRAGAALIVADPRRTELAGLAHIHLALRPGTDIALLNGMAHVILAEGLWDREFVEARTEGFEELQATVASYPPALAAEIAGVPVDSIVKAARAYATARPAAIFYTMGLTQHVTGHLNVLCLANLALLTGNLGKPGAGVNPLRGQNNVQGASDMGALPNVLPGYQPVTDPEARRKFEAAWGVPLPEVPGITVMEMVDALADGRVRGLYVIGENPMLTDPDLCHTREAMARADFLVVQDLFMTETAALAHVVLPAVSFAEKDGTFTNTERRIQRIRRAIPPKGAARSDGEIICDVAARLGYPMPYCGAAEVLDEIARLTPIYGGVSWARLEGEGLQWPCPAPDHPGTPILHVTGFPRGHGRLHGVEHLPPDERPDAEFPLVLTTGRVLYQYHSRTMTGRSPGLDALRPEPEVEVAPPDAERLGIRSGDRVRLVSRRGTVEVKASVTDRVVPGLLFLPFHYAQGAANVLTNPARDPVSRIPEVKVCAVRLEASDRFRRPGQAHGGGSP